MQTPKNHDWLPLPHGLSRRSHHSFTKELLSRFDKLYQQQEVISIDQCSIHSTETDISSVLIEPILTNKRRHRSAGDLLRKSSIYLKTKLYPDPWRKKSCTTLPTTNTNNNTTTTTTINLHNMPVITQYPPKPLIYSPVEPLLEDTDVDQIYKKTLHRFSMPLLSHTNDSVQNNRRKSDLISSPPLQHKPSIMHTMSKQWHRFMKACMKRKQ